MRERLIAGAITAALAVLGVACGDDGGDAAGGRGEAIYQANCSACHGDDLRGASTGPSLLYDIYGPDELADEEIAAAIREGVEEQRWDFGDMPANGALGDSQIDQIIDHIRTVQSTEGLDPTP